MPNKKKRLEIFVARISGNEFRNSRPCSHCTKTLKKYNIYRVYYTIGDGKYCREKVKDMISNHVSNGFRHLMRQNQ